ncbi:MAG: bifunctional phosphoribosylaminoimidazolecarboxamide formyltransferase/IMP cyclohydrolase, partial [Peptococcus niger]
MSYALLSVSDKTNLIPFAEGLIRHGYSLLSTGGTYRTLHEAGLEVKAVDDVTGFPEMLGGRVKTLHPVIHAGILAKETPEHFAELMRQHIQPID